MISIVMQFSLKKFFIIRTFILILIVFLVSFLINFRTDFNYVSPCFYKNSCTFLEKNIFYSLANFDGVHYLRIAAQGYSDQARFLPLYPLLIKFFSWTINQNINLWILFIALTISNFCLYGFLKLVWHILPTAGNNEHRNNQYRWLIILFLAFPTSFFLSSVYAESLFLFLVVLVFYLFKKGKLQWALLPAALLPVVKLQGIIIWPVFLYLMWQKRKSLKLKWNDYLISLIFMFLPLLAYMLFNFHLWDDPLHFVHAHGELANARATSGLVFPLQTVWRYIKILVTLQLCHEYWIAILELSSFGFLGGLIYLAWKQKLRANLFLYSLLVVSLPIFSGTFSGFPRYLLLAFPLWL